MQQLNLFAAGDSRGLIVHRASRTEHLAQKLARALARERPDNPLQAQTIVVGHAGLRRWLLGEFARSGKRGIAANFDVILPWQWLECVARESLGAAEPIGGAYRRELLRWHVHAALPDVDDATLAAYLAGSDRERRRFQLAEHLAGVFEQYLIYRPGWIAEWERNPRSGDWQADVWRRVRAAIGAPHRAQRSAALLQALARSPRAGAPLHVFGVSHLAPDVLAALQAMATRQSVHVYFTDPCREHWVHFSRRGAQLARMADPEELYFEVGHPLLAALGRMAQDFCIALDEADADIERDDADDAEPPARFASLLDAVQSSIRCAQPELVGGAIRALAADDESKLQLARRHLDALRTDASLRVHACHTRLRELEVLRDALLGFLARDPGLTHRDIVVMAPDISAYAPLLPAVFGAPARYAHDPAHIPWHLADVTLARTHPLLAAFVRVLDLRESRFAVSEVLDLLDVPALARRFGIDAPARESIERSLRRARVAWGLDAPMKEQAGGAPVAANSWQFGFDRVYAGAIAGDDVPEAFGGILPLGGINGATAEALGRLDRLLDELRGMREGFTVARPLAAWSDWLLARIDALFRADRVDDAEAAALDTLRRAIAALKGQAVAAGDDALSWSVARETVRGALDTIAERQPFLLGGVTFCGLVPQRSIPFKAVCMLGMNEGEFPRPSGDAGLNHMLRHPQRGDRDTRSEDRYLFLEALMSARAHLHISYIGADVRDGSDRNPASPLAELLQFLDDQHGLAAFDHGKLPRPWSVRHPLQPFDARYYERDPQHDPRLFSYTRAFAQAPHEEPQAAVFLVEPRASTPAEAGTEIPLHALKRFWRNPAKAILRDAAGISLEALDADDWPDREPLEASVDRRELVEARLLFDALASGADVPESPPAWLASSGTLAAGQAGTIAYRAARECAVKALADARRTLGERVQREPQAVDLDLGDGLRLTGTVENVFRNADRKLCLFGARPTREANFGDLLPFCIDAAALALSGTDAALEFVDNDAKSHTPQLLHSLRGREAEHSRAVLLRLIAAYRGCAAQPPLFFPKTAWAWATAPADTRVSRARSAWEGNGDTRGERDYGGYAALLARDLDLFDAASAAHARFVAATELAAAALDPQRSVLLRAGGDAC